MFLNGDCMPDDPDIQAGMFIMDPYTGKVIAVLGSRDERDGILLWNNATMTERQPGSSFKPLSAYSLGIENGAITYGSVLNDEPLEGSEEWNDGVGWPQNVSRTYKGHMNVDDAIMISQNAPVAWLVEEKHMSRKKASLVIFVGTWILGVICSLSFGPLSHIRIFGDIIFDFLDKFSSNVLMTVGALVIVLFVGWKMKKEDVRSEFTNGGTLAGNRRISGIVYFLIRYVAPPVIVIIFISNLL